jgi:hypothetical protein
MYSGGGLHVDVRIGSWNLSGRTYLCGMECAVLPWYLSTGIYLLVAYYFTILACGLQLLDLYDLSRSCEYASGS